MLLPVLSLISRDAVGQPLHGGHPSSLANSYPLWTVQHPQLSVREGSQNERYEKGTSQQYDPTVLCSHSQRLQLQFKINSNVGCSSNDHNNVIR